MRDRVVVVLVEVQLVVVLVLVLVIVLNLIKTKMDDVVLLSVPPQVRRLYEASFSYSFSPFPGEGYGRAVERVFAGEDARPRVW